MELWLVYLIAVVGACGILIPYYIITRRREKAACAGKEEKEKIEGKETGSSGDSVLCRVYDIGTRLVTNQEIPIDTVKKIREKVGNLGRKVLRDGKWVYTLIKKADSEHEPVAVPRTMEHPPSSLHRALLQDAVAIYYDVSKEKGFFQEHGKILLFVGAIIFLLWTVIMK